MNRHVNMNYIVRICPGNHLADATVFIVATLSLAVFDFNYAKDQHGRDIVPEFEFTPGTLTLVVTLPCRFKKTNSRGDLTRHPMPFQSACVPRSEKAAQLIRSIQEEHPWSSTDPQILSGVDWKSTASS